MTADVSLGVQDPVPPEGPPLTYAELVRRVALIHALIDEYEMKAIEESATRKRERAERDR